MRKRLLLLLALVLTLSGCHRGTWRLELETRRDADDAWAQDGTMLSWYTYELPRLAAVPADGARGEPPEELSAACDAFNDEIEYWRAQLLAEYDEMEQHARAAFPERGIYGFTSLGESVELTQSWRTPRLLSVRADGLADWGGAARPVPFAAAWSFDLAEGCFVSWEEMTDRPDALRKVFADAVLARIAASPEAYYPDCAAAVEALEGAALYFAADGVRLIFDTCVIAPRGEKLPEFTVPYETLAPYWNDYGRALLKEEK